ncbi:MAG: type II toxin-antitoxin system RelE/ParE family toxin [Firmicutes bacterium]|nr:type II toxin-antitoxin system RelE/ParE family toxin [Bacillota bacterium]
MHIEISQKARNDLQLIYDYLCESFGSKVAEDKLQEIKKDINLLGQMPFFGKALFDNLRKLNSGINIIIYEIQNHTVAILHVVDGRSDYARVLFPDVVYDY